MARSLQVNVQIDRLPDISGDQRPYVGARLSAWIDGPDQALSSDWHMLVPWEWSTADTNVPGSWNPGDPASWSAWWVDPTQVPPSVVGAMVTPVVNPDALNPPPAAWQTPRDQMLTQLASDHRSLEAPAKSTDPLRPAPISDQTVFGFVESLSSFPAPWPEMHKVWSCLRVDTAQPTASSELVVVPVFGTCGSLVVPASYKTPGPPILQGSVADHVWNVAYAAVAAPGISGGAVIDRLVEAPSFGSRILLKDKFLVGGAKGWASVAGQDWMVQLPGQLAGILDPAKGFSQALEQALGQYGANLLVAQRTPVAQQTAAQQDLLNVVLPATFGERSALRLLLGAAYWRVLASSATGTRSVAPLPLAFARSNISSDNQSFLAGLTARDAARDPAALDATIPGFMTVEKLLVWSDARLMALLGQFEDTRGAPEPPGVDTPEGLNAFLLSHWQNSAASSAALTSAPTSLMRFIATKWSGGQVVADPDGSFGLFDLTTLDSDASASVSFGLNTSQANAAVIVNLFFDGYPSAIATVQTDPIAGAGPHKLTVTVAPPPAPAPVAAPALPPAGGAVGPAPPPPPAPQPSFQISVDGGPAKAANFDEAALSKRRASISVQLPAGGSTVTLAAQPVAEDVVQKLLSSMPEPALRASATLVHSAPYIPLILAGTMHDGTHASGGPTDAIALALSDWAEYRLAAECDEAIRIAEALAALPQPSPIDPIVLADIQKVEPLFRYVRDVAIENAKAKASNLFAALASDAAGYELSAKATPVVFPIDQPQPIANTEDIWAMFAGVGVLVGVSHKRDPWPANDIWYSLNLASMYVPPVDPATHIRASLKDIQPVTPNPFDPVPLQIGEVGGVRAANLSYENRSLVGEMPHDPVHTSSAPAPAMPRRLEAYGFPNAAGGKNPKLPALCFGKRYFFLPYLIGHGGALAVFLRDPSNYAVATRLRPKNTVTGPDGRLSPDPSARLTFTSKALDDYLAGVTDGATGQPVAHEDCVRLEDYERTPPIGAPRIYGEKALPGVPTGVEALASEIPVQPAAITLGAGETAFFYRNQERTEGTLDFSSADPLERAIQIDFAGLPKGDDPSQRPELQVIVKARSGDKPLPPITIARNDWPQDSSLGVRIIAGRYGIEIFSQSAPRDIFFERPPRFGAPRTIDPNPVDFTNWQAFSVAISNGSAADITLIPPVVSLGTTQGTDHQLADARQVPLPETSHQKRVITLLDGIPPASASLNSVAIRVRRPTVEFNTFERWTNWDLGDPDIKTSLDLAHKMLVLDGPRAGDDVTIDDPAVERVVVELVELFPDPHLHGRAPMGADWSTKSAIINGYKTDRAADPRLPVRVAKPDDGTGAAERAGLSKNANGSAKEVILAPGGVYEIRFYGAVPEDKQSFSSSLPASEVRFGKGVWQGLRKFTLAGKKYRLGTPLVRTFEVATADMPALFDDKSDAPMSIDRRMALSGSGDRAQVTLGQDFVLTNYPKIRYANQILLLSQRWGWRGLPLGTLPVAADFRESVFTAPRPMPGFSPSVEDHGGRLKVQTLEDFESIAFIGRRDNDIGVIDESKLHLAHVLPPVDASGVILPAAADNRPPVFVKDLLYSGGANWWRFALAATSRYAAMKPGLDLTIYSHIDPNARLNAHWHTLIVRDRDTGRRPKRPGLLLVLPLTEKLMSDVAVPPLLAIFSEPMFSGFHIGDGVEATLDYARHPLPDAAMVWTDEDQARALSAKIASAYADFAGDTINPKKRQDLRVAVAAFNAFARAQGVVFASANLGKAQKNVDDAIAALKQAPPAQQQALQDALDLANRDKNDASVVLDRAKRADLAAQQQLQSVQQGGNDELPDVQAEMQRFWPQIGPDPILTSAAHSGRPVPIRLDGPIGYTFDLETEAPRFGRSGFLATPISGSNGGGAASLDLGIAGLANIRIRPWTLARLRFRRLEAIELSLYKPVALSDRGGPVDLLLSSEAIDLTKVESTATVAAPAAPPAPPKTPVPPVQPPIVPPLVPPEYHEGLSIDFAELDERGADATIRVLKGTVTNPPPASPPPWSDHYVHVSATVTPGALSILLNTDLGPAGTYDVPLRPTTRTWLRLVLSQREKPEQSQKPYEPVLDVSVRLLIDDGDGDGLARSQVGAWVTVACLPLLAGGKTFRPSDPIYVNVTQDPKKPAAQATGVRLTPFTAPVWCQFTQDVSTFNVKTTTQGDSLSCTVADLAATMDSKNALKLSLVVDAAGTSQPLQSIEWLARDPASQLRCSVAAVVTEFISDAFDRVRERPLAVYRIDDGANQSAPATMQCIWPTSLEGLDIVAKTKLAGARVRLITLMHLQLDPLQPTSPPASLADYFSEPFQADIDMNASDASGRILGVSKPIEVTLGS